MKAIREIAFDIAGVRQQNAMVKARPRHLDIILSRQVLEFLTCRSFA